jgi:hypothetical protein
MQMTTETVPAPSPYSAETVARPASLEPAYLQWTPIIAGALAAMALILVTFAAAVGLGVSSTSPSWRDASAAL